MEHYKKTQAYIDYLNDTYLNKYFKNTNFNKETIYVYKIEYRSISDDYKLYCINLVVNNGNDPYSNFYAQNNAYTSVIDVNAIESNDCYVESKITDNIFNVLMKNYIEFVNVIKEKVIK
jgi:hypothetical protein